MWHHGKLPPNEQVSVPLWLEWWCEMELGNLSCGMGWSPNVPNMPTFSLSHSMGSRCGSWSLATSLAVAQPEPVCSCGQCLRQGSMRMQKAPLDISELHQRFCFVPHHHLLSQTKQVFLPDDSADRGHRHSPQPVLCCSSCCCQGCWCAWAADGRGGACHCCCG